MVIDNASRQRVASTFDLSWHPNARHLHEPELGLTPARLRGIAEANADLICFVDDDNILTNDYLETCLAIADAFPFLGAWGGNIQPEFEMEPPVWAKPYLGMLALLKVDHDVWSNLTNEESTVPWGAGMCVRSYVAKKYAESVFRNPTRQKLGRKGTELASAEDVDLAFTACDLGLGTGRFSQALRQPI